MFNQGFTQVYDGDFKRAVTTFRQIQTYKPMNYVAANNLATCKVFLNHVAEAIITLENVVKT